MRVLIDTREQTPFQFYRYEAENKSATLPAGDYSLPGFEDRVAVERKSLPDLIAYLMSKNRERFERELVRLRPYELAAVVIEASMQECGRGSVQVRDEAPCGPAIPPCVSGPVRGAVHVGRDPRGCGIRYLLDALKVSPGD